MIGEEHPLIGDAIDVRGLAHDPVRVGADVPGADVVAEDDEDVRLLARLRRLLRLRATGAGESERRRQKNESPVHGRACFTSLITSRKRIYDIGL